MTKEIVKVRIRIRADIIKVTLVEIETYGVLIDNTTIIVDGYTFHAGRKTGFGKSAYIYERVNNKHCKITIDQIEKVA